MTGKVDRVGGAPNVRLEAARIVAVRLLEKRDRDVARARLERHANRESLVDLVARRRRVVARGGHVLVAAERREMHAPAVDADLELMRELETAHRAEIGSKQSDLELILAVERDVPPDHETTDSPKGKAFHVP